MSVDLDFVPVEGDDVKLKEALKGWVRTVFLPYTGRLPEALREDFVEQIARAYIERRPPDENGHVHVQMVRLEVQATM